MQAVTELRSKATELRKIADKLDAAATALVALGGNGSATHVPLNATSELGDLAELSGIDAIERILRDTGTPLRKKEIHEKLKTRGKAIGYGTLEAYLSREKKRFKSMGSGKWWLAKESFIVE